MPPDVTSVSLIVCEKVETDENGLFSAIRVADVFELDEGPIRVHALLLIKTEPSADPNTEHRLDVVLFNSQGLAKRLTREEEKVRYFSDINRPGVYGGITAILEVPLLGSPGGIYLIRVYLDGEEVSKAPVMLLTRAEASD